MMPLQHTFLTRFFFVLFAAVVVLFVLGFIWPVFEWIAPLFLLALFVFLGIDFLLCFLENKPLEAKRIVPTMLNLGDENRVEIEITNKTNQAQFIELIEGYPVELQIRNKSFKTKIAARGKSLFAYSFKPAKRGDFQFGNLLFYISSPLFLVKRKFEIEQAQIVQVFPSILQMRRYELQVFHQQTQAKGIKKVRRIGNNNEFEQIKNYVQGDDVRTVNWKATSKRTELMVNQYQEERAQHIYAIIDKSRNMQSEFEGMSLLDYAINSSLVFSNIALRKGDKAGLITFSNKIGTQLKAERSSGHLRRILFALYGQKTHFNEASFELLYQSIHQTVKTRSLLMIYTNFESEFAMRRALPTLKRINQRHVLVVVIFQNNTLEEKAYEETHNLESVYQATVAEKLMSVKGILARELKQHGIQTVLTRPEDLSISTINKYLELKAKGVI